MPTIPSVVASQDIDTLPAEQIAERLQKTREYIQAIRDLWPGLVRLEEKERRASIGKSLVQLRGPLRALFTLLAPKNGETPPIAKVFDAIGGRDEGADPERFEAELLLRRLGRVEAENAVVAELEALSRDIADDVLATGESVVVPGLLALSLARSLSKGNPTYRSELRTVLDGLRDMTKRARQHNAAKSSPAKGPVGPAGDS